MQVLVFPPDASAAVCSGAGEEAAELDSFLCTDDDPDAASDDVFDWAIGKPVAVVEAFD